MKEIKIKKTSKERKQFFLELKERCTAQEVYSVIETAEEMGVSYEQVEEWANKNELLRLILEECRSMCADNDRGVDYAGLRYPDYQNG